MHEPLIVLRFMDFLFQELVQDLLRAVPVVVEGLWIAGSGCQRREPRTEVVNSAGAS